MWPAPPPLLNGCGKSGARSGGSCRRHLCWVRGCIGVYICLCRRAPPPAKAAVDGASVPSTTYTNQHETMTPKPQKKTPRYTGHLDGVKWKGFVGQFGIQPQHLPRVFVLDFPSEVRIFFVWVALCVCVEHELGQIIDCLMPITHIQMHVCIDWTHRNSTTTRRWTRRTRSRPSSSTSPRARSVRDWVCA